LLDLSRSAWVVLSSCDGIIPGGEGALGLRPAFRAAGARALVMTPVERDRRLGPRLLVARVAVKRDVNDRRFDLPGCAGDLLLDWGWRHGERVSSAFLVEGPVRGRRPEAGCGTRRPGRQLGAHSRHMEP